MSPILLQHHCGCGRSDERCYDGRLMYKPGYNGRNQECRYGHYCDDRKHYNDGRHSVRLCSDGRYCDGRLKYKVGDSDRNPGRKRGRCYDGIAHHIYVCRR